MLYPRFVLTLVLTGLLTTISTPGFAETQRNEHPLAPLLADAAMALERIEREIPGYTCTFIKRERVDGKVWPTEHLQLKVRHQKTVNGELETPFSVYARFEKSRQKGRELIYIDGQNDGRMLVRNGGRRLPNLTLSLKPTGGLAMTGNRYPIMNIGIEQLLQRMIMIGTGETKWGECEVERTPGAVLNRRKCTLIQITHPVPRPHFRYHVARIFTDDELLLPIRFEAYLWPEEEGGPLPLLEQYTYLNLQLDPPTDHDFDPLNEAYSFHVPRPAPAVLSPPIELAKSEKTIVTSQQRPVDASQAETRETDTSKLTKGSERVAASSEQ